MHTWEKGMIDRTYFCTHAVLCCALQVLGSFRDADAVRAFAADVDVLTVEIEHVDADAMDTVVNMVGCDVEPTPSTLRTIQVQPIPSPP